MPRPAGRPEPARPAKGGADGLVIDRPGADRPGADRAAAAGTAPGAADEHDMPEALALAVSHQATRARVEHGFQPGGARQTAPARAQAGGRAASRGTDLGADTMMEVQESPFESAPALEEAAILYANRQDAAAQLALEETLQADDLPPQAARQAWLMLFDLYENQGRRAEFESAAIKYALRFETSPPTFSERTAPKTPGTASGPQVALTGHLDAAAARQFAHLRTVAGKNPTLRIDLAKVESVAAAGSDELRTCLAALRKSGHAVTLAGAEHVIALLNGQVETGRADIPETYWLLLLDLYQALGLHDLFEETALNYCITYEVSPPSWVDAPQRAAQKHAAPGAAGAPKAGAAGAPEAGDGALCLRGEIEGNADATLKEIGALAAERSDVVIDVHFLKRMDFLAAGALLNLVAALKAAGKSVEMRGPSPLLATLFVTMGFPAYAKMTRRKY